MYFRVIGSATRWHQQIKRPGVLYDGDMISDLRTNKNTLSFFKINNSNDKDEIISIAALVALNRDKLDKVSYVLFDDSELDIYYKDFETPALCKVLNKKADYLKCKHVNLCQIDYVQMGTLAELIKNKVSNGNNYNIIADDIYDKIKEFQQKGLIDDIALKQKIDKEFFPKDKLIENVKLL